MYPYTSMGQRDPLPEDYYSPDPARLTRLIEWGRARDERLNKEERQVLEDTQRECELGPRWWLRAHP